MKKHKLKLKKHKCQNKNSKSKLEKQKSQNWKSTKAFQHSSPLHLYVLRRVCFMIKILKSKLKKRTKAANLGNYSLEAGWGIIYIERGFEHSPPHIYVYARLGSCVVESCVCALQSLCGSILWVSAAESEFAHLIVMENPSASNNFKRRSVEQLKGTCYCYVLYFSRKP